MKTKYLKIIERYLNDQMDQEEKQRFEGQLETNDELRREFDEFKAVYEAIGDTDTIELRKDLKEIGGEFKEKGERDDDRRDSSHWIWLAAVLIISLSVVSVTYLLMNSPFSPFLYRVGAGQGRVDQQLYYLDPVNAEIFKYKIRSENFHLEHPRDSVVVERRTDIAFRWTFTGKMPVYLDILNRNGKIVFSTGTPAQSPFLLLKNLSQGIYVYRFRTDSKTLHTGVFYVI